MIYTVTLNPAIDREYRVEEIKYGTDLRASDVHIDFGGKGFNVSHFLTNMKIKNIAIGFLGGWPGKYIASGLESIGVEIRPIWIDGETRTNVSFFDKTSNKYIKVNDKGPTLMHTDEERLFELIESLAAPGDIWILAGNLTPGLAEDIYKRMLEFLNTRSVKTIIDTSGQSLRLSLKAKPYLVKPNAEEAQSLTRQIANSIQDYIKMTSMIRDMGAQNVIISLGEKGAVLQTSEGTWVYESPVIKKNNPIGAGDCLVGGVVFRLIHNDSLAESTKWGIASGAAAASLPGTQIGSLRQIQSLAKKVKFYKIE